MLTTIKDVSSQEGDGTPSIVQYSEQSFFGFAHTRGIGLGFRHGKIMNVHTTLQWEVDFSTMKHPKEFRRTNEAYPNMRTYSYGKLNNVYMFRGGVGLHRVIAEKPYWGGVKVRYNIFAGANLSIAEPVYLYILNYIPADNSVNPVLERYDPDNHFSDNIYGRGPLGKGLSEAKLYPGLYFKGGFNFDYSGSRDQMRALEVGVLIDMFPKKIPIMAFAHNPNIFINFYIALHIGVFKS